MNLTELAEAKGFSVEELSKFGLRDGVYVNGKGEIPAVVMPVYDLKGDEFRLCYRTSTEDGEGFCYDTQKEKGNIPYGLQRPVPVEKFLYIVEGQSDCWSFWTAGLPCLGIPGATSTNCLSVDHVFPATKVIVVQEPDEAGGRFPFRVAQRLYDAGYMGEVYSVSLEGFKDAREAFNAQREAFRKVLESAWSHRTRQERPKPTVSAVTEHIFKDVEELTVAYKDDTSTIRNLVEGLLPEGGTMAIGAKKKAGKTVFICNLAKSVARGEPFLGRRCRQGPVLFGSFDEPKAVTLERFEALGLKGQAGIHLWSKRGRLGEEWPVVCRTIIERIKPRLFIVDTLAKLAGVSEINSYGEWNKAFAPLHAIADELGVAVVVTVHNKKQSGIGFDGFAGSSGGIGGNVDTSVLIERDAQDCRTIETEQRVGHDMHRTMLLMDPNSFEVSIGYEEWLEKQRNLQAAIAEALTGKELTLDELLETMGKRSLEVKRALYAAIDAEQVTFHGKGVKGDPKKYCLIEAVPATNKQPRVVEEPIQDDLLAYAEELLG